MPHTLTNNNNIIDHIFALKKQKKQKKKFRSQSQPVHPKSSAPQIVQDPSSRLSIPISHDPPSKPSKKRKRNLAEKLDQQDKFNDSRGTSSRRKTEEGFSIYKEDELGINIEVGGTPLCPFDCNCCF